MFGSVTINVYCCIFETHIRIFDIIVWRDSDVTYSVHLALFAQLSREHLRQSVIAPPRFDVWAQLFLISWFLGACACACISKRERARARVYLVRSRVNGTTTFVWPRYYFCFPSPSVFLSLSYCLFLYSSSFLSPTLEDTRFYTCLVIYACKMILYVVNCRGRMSV